MRSCRVRVLELTGVIPSRIAMLGSVDRWTDPRITPQISVGKILRGDGTGMYPHVAVNSPSRHRSFSRLSGALYLGVLGCVCGRLPTSHPDRNCVWMSIHVSCWTNVLTRGGNQSTPASEFLEARLVVKFESLRQLSQASYLHSQDFQTDKLPQRICGVPNATKGKNSRCETVSIG
ncbi:hypothetical protein P153DRAFT_199512 [Dothidotthia symphoricarpi CBS 119687]|uniref:Uncharacterized protein n=1 Tax=Dothidotthia symphoricarpi CBS 119687 TaxID=1392245 RepID=A0A6A6AM97_9PLEO|nr:uncharacterized protein P153DRAFT_199512 [Dothidotthia symphoricarpi CBS 119687]KAF2131601.1 hypothetical protein P153DRAFT_199512 [Dothidotthia symphoricarpi CBS 119687]